LQSLLTEPLSSLSASALLESTTDVEERLETIEVLLQEIRDLMLEQRRTDD